MAAWRTAGALFLCMVYLLVTFGSAAYAYRENLRASPDEQKSFPLLGVYFAPVLFPLLVFLLILLTLAGAFLLGILLVILPVGFLLVRKPFLLKWIKKIALYLGRKILRFARLLSIFKP